MKEVVGTPAPLLLPAQMYKQTYESGPHSINVPTRGTYPEGCGFEGSYDIYPQDGVVNFGELLKVLFAERAYPALRLDQRFVISGVEVVGATTSIFGWLVSFSGEVVNG